MSPSSTQTGDVAFGQGNEALTDGVGARSAFPEPVGVLVGTSLGDGLESQHVERLDGAVQHGGNGQRLSLPFFFGM